MTEVEATQADERHRLALRDSEVGSEIRCELDLVQHLVRNSRELLPDYPLLVLHEWDVVPGATQYGVGDLVFSDGRGHYAVVEVKFLNPDSGHTARESRRRGRQAVRWQAKDYGRKLFHRIPSASRVTSFTYTTDRMDRPVAVGAFHRDAEGEVVALAPPAA